MKAVILGAYGQVGRALTATVPNEVTLTTLSRAQMDCGDFDRLRDVITDLAPGLIINAAAYTAVDRAEQEVDLAMRINGVMPGELATVARSVGARLVHISTDFVFDGRSSLPIAVDAPLTPLQVYGRSKGDGENAVRAAMADALIIRTAWVYAAQGNNFVRTMLRVGQSGTPIRVVADQIGTPTHATSLACTLWALTAHGETGTFHATDAGVASWYDFAVAIFEEAVAVGLVPTMPDVVPITTVDYPTAARRPAYSVLDKAKTWATLGKPAPHWRTELRDMLRTTEKAMLL